MSTSAPERSLEQRLLALQHANEIRTGRARLKRRIRAGHESVVDILINPPVWVETMTISQLLIAMPHVGRVKVNNALLVCRIAHSTTIGGISDRQRHELVNYLLTRTRARIR